jgi:glucose/arabinose dehydrogenase
MQRKRRGATALVLLLALLGLTGGVLQAYQGIRPAGSWSISLPTITNGSRPDIILEPFADGLSDVTNITHAGDERLFVSTKQGIIYIVHSDGTVAEEPFLDIRDRVESDEFEQGFLGLAFHPDYASNGFFYVLYTNLDRDSAISRFTVDATNPDRADPASEELLLEIWQPGSRHRAGAMAFGPNDGYLYIAAGDGGARSHAQDLLLLRGKILRIDVDSGEPYGIPPENPFVNDLGRADEIWAYGLRNPWRITFDRQTGDLYITDVGEESWEEINVQPATSEGGENYGWPCYEGLVDFELELCESPTTFVFPQHVYAHEDGNCAITGGYVYRGAARPDAVGRYFFADFCASRFWALTAEAGGWTVSRADQHLNIHPTTFGEGADGELYVGGSFGAAVIYHVVWNH